VIVMKGPEPGWLISVKQRNLAAGLELYELRPSSSRLHRPRLPVRLAQPRQARFLAANAETWMIRRAAS
jgi:hypothetical protein